MARREKVAPEGTELSVLKMLVNGYSIRIKNGKTTVGTVVPVSADTLNALLNKKWVTYQRTDEVTRIYVITKRGREALVLALEEAPVLSKPVDPRFGVVVPAPKGG